MEKNAPQAPPAAGQYFKTFGKKIVYAVKHPLLLLPTLLIMIIWILLGFLKSHFGESRLLSVFNFLTFAQGGLFGGVVGAIGGIIGKILIASLLNALILPLFVRGKRPGERFREGFRKFGESFAFDSLRALSVFLLGMGLALLLYSLVNITQRWQEGLVGIAGALVLIRSIGRKGGMVGSLLYSLVSGLSKKIPSQITVTRFISGMSVGFVAGTGMNLVGLRWAVLIALVALVLGIFFFLFGNRRKAAVATACLCAFLLLPVRADEVKKAVDRLGGAARTLDGAMEDANQLVDELNKLNMNFNPEELPEDFADRMDEYNARIETAKANRDKDEVKRLYDEMSDYYNETTGAEMDFYKMYKDSGGDGSADGGAADFTDTPITHGWADEDSYIDGDAAAAVLEAGTGLVAAGAAAGGGMPFGGGEGGPDFPDYPESPDPEEPEPKEETEEEEEPEEEEDPAEEELEEPEESEEIEEEPEESEEPEEEPSEEASAEEEPAEEEEEESAEEEEESEEKEGSGEIPEEPEEQPVEEAEEQTEEQAEEQAEETEQAEEVEEEDDYDYEAERAQRAAEQERINRQYLSDFRQDADQFASHSDEERISREVEREMAEQEARERQEELNQRVLDKADQYHVATTDEEGNQRDISDIKEDTQKAIKKDINKTLYKNELAIQQICNEVELKSSEKIAEYELVDNVSEGTVNILGECTGPAGKQVKNWHAFLKATAVGYQEAKCDGRNRFVGTLGGMVEGGFTVGQNIIGDDGVLPGPGGFKKMLAVGTTTVFFEGSKTIVHEGVRGTNPQEILEKAQTSMVKKSGEVLITSVMGSTFDKVPGIAKNKFGASESTFKMFENIGKGTNAAIGETYSRGHDMMTVGDKNISEHLTSDFMDWKTSKVEKLF